jgi:hypothetical protein
MIHIDTQSPRGVAVVIQVTARQVPGAWFCPRE